MMWSPRACLEMISDACRLRSIQSSPRWGNMSLCGVRAFIRWQKGALTAGIVKKWWNFKGPIMMGLPFPYYSYAIPTFETSTVWEDVWKWGPISQRVTVHLPWWDTHSQFRKFTMLLVVVLANIRGYFYNNPTILASQLEEGQASNPNVPWHSIKKCIPCSCVVSFPLTI